MCHSARKATAAARRRHIAHSRCVSRQRGRPARLRRPARWRGHARVPRPPRRTTKQVQLAAAAVQAAAAAQRERVRPQRLNKGAARSVSRHSQSRTHDGAHHKGQHVHLLRLLHGPSCSPCTRTWRSPGPAARSCAGGTFGASTVRSAGTAVGASRVASCAARAARARCALRVRRGAAHHDAERVAARGRLRRGERARGGISAVVRAECVRARVLRRSRQRRRRHRAACDFSCVQHASRSACGAALAARRPVAAGGVARALQRRRAAAAPHTTAQRIAAARRRQLPLVTEEARAATTCALQRRQRVSFVRGGGDVCRSTFGTRAAPPAHAACVRRFHPASRTWLHPHARRACDQRGATRLLAPAA
jgi:hypothetical protein